jgi:hypothetical protein
LKDIKPLAFDATRKGPYRGLSYTEEGGEWTMAKAGSGYIAITTASPIGGELSPKTERNYLAWIDANLEFGRY